MSVLVEFWVGNTVVLYEDHPTVHLSTRCHVTLHRKRTTSSPSPFQPRSYRFSLASKRINQQPETRGQAHRCAGKCMCSSCSVAILHRRRQPNRCCKHLCYPSRLAVVSAYKSAGWFFLCSTRRCASLIGPGGFAETINDYHREAGACPSGIPTATAINDRILSKSDLTLWGEVGWMWVRLFGGDYGCV